MLTGSDQLKQAGAVDVALPSFDLTAAMDAWVRNRSGAKLMHKYDEHACTDVTGFGILGHAQNLVVTQHKDVDFVVHTLPIIRDMEKLDKKIHDFKLLEGFSGA